MATNSTKNTKGNRRVVTATYPPFTTVFKIPDNLDLEDKSVVKSWRVKYNQLYINFVSGMTGVIEPYWDACDEANHKSPEDYRIEDAEEVGMCVDDDYPEDEDCCSACEPNCPLKLGES
tara:strand:- start:1024 stop:1380 length:357 start_codon:yes stop_codon:yes gene_type:complete